MSAYERLLHFPVFRGGFFASHAPARMPDLEAALYPTWAVLADRVRRSAATSVVEIGCGSGQLASLLRDLGIKDYLGLDSNPARLEPARAACPGYRFELADVFLSNHLRVDHYDLVVMTGFLEFVRRDLVMLESIRPHTRVLGSVTSGDEPDRVRQFTTANQVLEQYSPVLRELHVEPIHLVHGRTAFLFEGIR